MQDNLAQLILAGPGDGGEGWMNILFIVVLAVFWVISGIIKATSQKSQNSQKQQSSRMPARTATPPTTARDSSSPRPKRMAQARTQSRQRLSSHVSELEKAFRSKAGQVARILESSPSKSEGVSITKDLPKLASKPLTELEQLRLDSSQKTPEAEDLPELVLDYTDPDELSKAILHFEILGPPVSLRPSHRITGF